MRKSSPRHKATPPRRMLALGGAFAVSTLTIGGALGVVPGAALGNAPHHGSGSPAGSDVQLPDAPATGTASAGGDTSATDTEGRSSDPPPERANDSEDGAAVEIPARSGHGKRIVFDQSAQHVRPVGPDEVQRSYPVSGSLHDNLAVGRYEVYSRSRHAVSFDGRETMDFMVRFAHGLRAPIGFHDIPVDDDGERIQSRAELGTPQSAGCIRQWGSDARALWAFAPVGTKVVVVD